jgi:hypothetical protein
VLTARATHRLIVAAAFCPLACNLLKGLGQHWNAAKTQEASRFSQTFVVGDIRAAEASQGFD